MDNNVVDMLQWIAAGNDVNRPITRPETSNQRLLWLKRSVIPTLVKMFLTNQPDYMDFKNELEKAIGDALFPE
jgi:hypothetical protein